MQAASKKVVSKKVELQLDKLENYRKQQRLVYCMSKHEIASSNFADLMHVQILNGVSCGYYTKPKI